MTLKTQRASVHFPGELYIKKPSSYGNKDKTDLPKFEL